MGQYAPQKKKPNKQRCLENTLVLQLENLAVPQTRFMRQDTLVISLYEMLL